MIWVYLVEDVRISYKEATEVATTMGSYRREE